ncbi:PREDICTED: LOW QUALITY PROTEIN: cyclin-dependent kinase inhibitor 1C [Nanorana parkeri]|uniref:LOW QUALITY PROTEIN: cyclin-dependent kinase inhibitor 1C n=1 Tax=Nanorana parkeri TaxID=125878 RepID=UPI000854AF21|nr:PREDICTED: LOW QUALITY PROTEIN: cyclin-dependent kinase inhibitor 1C [Nanorana parkeri]
MCNVQQADVALRPGPSVCRSLFGPVDHAELSRELHSRLREMEEESNRRWDFDFQRGVPLSSSRYVWEESREDTVPAFYRAPPRLRATISTPESTDDTQTANNSTPMPAIGASLPPLPNLAPATAPSLPPMPAALTSLPLMPANGARLPPATAPSLPALN